MTGRLRVAPIVEGHGEFHSVGILLRRIWNELLGGEYIEVLKPIRHPQGTLLQPDGEGLRRAVRLALLKLLDAPSDDPALVLILIDSEGECPAALGARLLNVATEVDTRADVACVLAHVMYETWFVAAAGSLTKYLDLGRGVPPDDPEQTRLGSPWIAGRMREVKYDKVVHQPRMTAAMNLNDCLASSRSFRKLYRELEKRMAPSGPHE